jgi:hypothetical protein
VAVAASETFDPAGNVVPLRGESSVIDGRLFGEITEIATGDETVVADELSVATAVSE